MRLKALLDGVSSFLPPPLIFIGVDTGVLAGEVAWRMRNQPLEAFWSRHVEAGHELGQCRFGRPTVAAFSPHLWPGD
jgi:hypothetical protein